jgi:hypothetical protein
VFIPKIYAKDYLTSDFFAHIYTIKEEKISPLPRIKRVAQKHIDKNKMLCYTHFANIYDTEGGFMKLHEELYFEITAEGDKNELQKFISYITSGELDDYFEFSSDFIIYDDNFYSASYGDAVSVTISNDDFGIEIEDFDPEDFLDTFCKGGKEISLWGHLYDIDDEEYRFNSPAGDPCYTNAAKINKFNDELDEEAYKEEQAADEDDEF